MITWKVGSMIMKTIKSTMLLSTSCKLAMGFWSLIKTVENSKGIPVLCERDWFSDEEKSLEDDDLEIKQVVKCVEQEKVAARRTSKTAMKSNCIMVKKMVRWGKLVQKRVTRR